MLKMALFDCAIKENVAVLTEDGAFAIFFRPHSREFANQGKKNANAWGSARRGRGGGGGGGPGGGGGTRRRWNCLMHNRILEPVHEFRMYSKPPFLILNVGKGFDMSF